MKTIGALVLGVTACAFAACANDPPAAPDPQEESTVILSAVEGASLMAAEDPPDDPVVSTEPDADEHLLVKPGGPIAAMACASLDQWWNSVPERELAYYLCTFPTGTCSPIYVTVNETVECSNTCSNTTMTCRAYSADYPTHNVTRPAHAPDSSCEIPCNEYNPCDRCTP